jgi:hypothetical protein
MSTLFGKFGHIEEARVATDREVCWQQQAPWQQARPS